MMRIFVLLFFTCLCNQLVNLENIDDIITCLKGTDCDEFSETDNYTETYEEENFASISLPNVTIANIPETTPSNNLINVTQSTQLNKTTPSIILHKLDMEVKNHSIHKMQSEICECDLTVASCDINCCCDMDCKDYQLTVFSHCKDYHTELYDSRYCYSRNFIERNNTPFILEKLANNLFCILYDNLPPMYSISRNSQNVISGQIVNGWLQCSGLVTSIQFDILYSVLPKPESLTNYDILGVGVKFSEELDISWPKCMVKNCTDMLQIDIVSFVTFHDISKPSRYYFAGGPNLDLTLPYDFFYPFLGSGTVMIESSIILIYSILYITIMFSYH